ncbi:MAG: peptidoglycan DD-metalloendopeptidase family protein [Candidatus Nitrosopelagicus sp.]|nr:peptidoglycan DD-metalloendopeptidase family protein [Candidatus Nitrosopelagicus sp.]
MDYQSEAINNVRKEIEETRRRIKSEKKKEKSTARRLTNIDKEISLTDKLYTQLKQELGKNETEIDKLSTAIQANEHQLEILRDRYAVRVVQMYKKGTLADIEKLFSSSSWRQAVYRAKYMGVISNIDQKTQNKIKSLLIDIGRQRIGLESSYRNKVRLKKDQEDSKVTLRASRKKRQQELDKIRNNQSELTKYLEEKQAGMQELESLLKKVRQERSSYDRADRIRKQQAALKTETFGKLKGQLPWPAAGRVVKKFGRTWNSERKTTTENPGIDIKGKPGSPVRSVIGGIITTITYIRGYGTTIIIDHGGGFYTVYSHVTNVETNEEREVQAGDIIAYMGNAGSIDGSKLHFEIWGHGQKLNPEKWLMKR